MALNWTDPASDGGAAITGYVVQANDNDSGWATIPLVGSLAGYRGVWDGQTLSGQGSFVVRVAAITSAGTGSYSAPSAPVWW